MISDARGGHVSPGIYTEERDVTYSVKSLGVTSLGAVGETLKGPAFQSIPIESWSEFVDYFGGTSTEKYVGNGRPKYELPYIAKSYLEESRRLNVVRVLGLSGYNAGPAWVLYNKQSKPVLVLRSKMSYLAPSDNLCVEIDDKPHELIQGIKKVAYSEPLFDGDCVGTSKSTKSENDPLRFGLSVQFVDVNYPIIEKADELNGTTEEKITVSYKEGEDTKEVKISENKYYKEHGYDKVLVKPADNGKWKLYTWQKPTAYNSGSTVDGEYIENEYDLKEARYNVSLNPEDKRYIYNVLPKSPTEGDAPIYIDSVFEGNLKENSTLDKDFTPKGKKEDEIEFTDYSEGFRAAATPWIVSNVEANKDESGNTIATMKKLFRAITISDGNASNYQVKISVQRIDPFKGTFDLVVRDFYDTDESPLILEKFSNCTMVEGDASYVGFKVGTSDGGYVTKSKYITLEMAEGEGLEKCVPAGFVGYPSVFGSAITLNYATEYNPLIKARKQYFGMNSRNVETDMLDYKGKQVNYDHYDATKLSNGFHLDAILETSGATAYVDGMSGYTFTSVSSKKVVASKTRIPRIMAAPYMNETIYEDINLRKFTVYPCGGFDGWDVNRESRTNTDDYSATRYPVSGSSVFSAVDGGYRDMLNLPSNAITSDYYAYLGGYRQFANPEDVDIDLFVTPGIDWVHNLILTNEVISMIEDSEDRGGDALYIIDSPQYSDMKEQYTVDEIASDLEDSGLDTSYGCTYFPWVKYFDTTAKRYIGLPVTKDVVRNMAKTDNNQYSWFAPAGIDRGEVKCLHAIKKTTISEEDTLYEVGINPVKSFARDGVKIWGNKTLYSAESPLNRINVRRLMIRVKKLIKDAARNLIFEQYDASLEKQFRSLVEPILTEVKQNRGISDYRLQIESSAEARDEHILPAKILIKPTPALEYISLSFVVYPESVAFDE